MKSAYNAIRAFWCQVPSLRVGIIVFLGCWAGLQWYWSLLLPLAGLLACASPKQIFCLTSLWLCVLICCTVRFELPSLPNDGVPGNAYFSISRISDAESFMGSGWVLKGDLLHFDGPSPIRNGRIRIFFPSRWEKPRPEGGYLYHVSGKLRALGNGNYSLKVSRDTLWLKEKSTVNTTEWRYRTKQAVSGYMKSQFEHPKVAGFLIGLTTGEFFDKQTQTALSRIGVQHLLAISGFHFALFATFLSVIFRTLLPKKIATLLLIGLLTSYFLFLGYGASIARAWLMIALALLAEMLELPYKGLNILGVALVALLLWDPLAALETGFQLSFLAAGAILLLYPVVDGALDYLLPKRPLSGLAEMHRWDQQAYVLLCLFRQASALVLAVHLTVMPVCLYLFNNYPLIGLVANLFYPFMAGLSLTWLALSLPMHLIIPPAGEWMHSMNNRFTESLLGLAYNIPPRLQMPLQVSQLQEWMIVMYLTLILGAGMILFQRMTDMHLDQGGKL